MFFVVIFINSFQGLYTQSGVMKMHVLLRPKFTVIAPFFGGEGASYQP